MTLPAFTVNGTIQDIVSTGSGLTSPVLAATVTFTPNINTPGSLIVWQDGLYKLEPVVAGPDSSGQIGPVKLLANDSGLNFTGLQWRVDICNKVGGSVAASWWFDAPADGQTIDLATVAHAPGVQVNAVDAYHRPSTGIPRSDLATSVQTSLGKADTATQPADLTAAVNAVINGAPGALDTLKELADALGDDANFAATVTTALAGKVPWSGGTAGILPATSGQHLTTQGGNTLDDGAGNMTLAGALTVNGASKLVSIGVHGYAGGMDTRSTSTAGTSEVMFTVGASTSGVSALWTHYYTTTSGTITDTDPAGSITFNASLKVVSSSNPGTVTGTIYRLTFGGRTSATLDPGGRITADVLGLSLAPGDVVAIRTFLSSGTAYAVRSLLASGWGGFTSTTDLTAPGSTTIASSFGTYYTASALLGYPENANNAKSVVVIGDSIGQGYYDNAIHTAPSIGYLAGFVQRALVGVAGVVNAAIPSDSASYFKSTTGSTRRLPAARYCNSAIITYGANDINLISHTALQVETDNLAIATAVRRLGVAKVFITTLVPWVTSTNGFATLGNQTAVATESTRLSYNAWVRACCPVNPTTKAPVAVGTLGALLAGNYGHPITGYFDTAATVESSLNSGKWAVPNRVATGSITSGSSTLTSSTAVFQSTNQEAGGDLDAEIRLIGAGASGADLATNIGVVGSTTSVTLGAPAGTTVTNAVLIVGAMTHDGIHPTSRGHYLMSHAINTALL